MSTKKGRPQGAVGDNVKLMDGAACERDVHGDGASGQAAMRGVEGTARQPPHNSRAAPARPSRDGRNPLRRPVDHKVLPIRCALVWSGTNACRVARGQIRTLGSRCTALNSLVPGICI